MSGILSDFTVLLSNFVPSIHKYVIKHVKDKFGNDCYLIYHLLFGCIKIKFIEYDISCFDGRWEVRPWHYIYNKLSHCKRQLDWYKDMPTCKYKGHTLTQIHGKMWVDYANHEYLQRFKKIVYPFAGDLDTVKEKINTYIKAQLNKNFTEYIDYVSR